MNSPDSTFRAFDLYAAARSALRQNGFDADLPADAAQQLATLPTPIMTVGSSEIDLRHLVWSSIDDDSSRDLDQIEVAESVADGIRVQVGVADVDVLVPKGSPLDIHAEHNATTVYTGVQTLPMLPIQLSTDRTSLAPQQDRWALVIEYTVAGDGTLSGGTVTRALVRNQAQLAYDSVGAWLDGTGPAPASVAANTALAAQLRLQREAARCLRLGRAHRGALELETVESAPVVEDGHVVELRSTRPGAARDLIEDFMIGANSVIATYLEAQGRSAIRRVVRPPARWARIVELARATGVNLPASPDGLALASFLAARQAADPTGFPDLSLAVIKLLGPGAYVVEAPGAPATGHFGLAVDDYTHGTAPNRRYADLVTERLLKATIAGSPPPYTDAELAAIATHCTAQEDNARHAARLVHKEAAAVLLAPRTGEVFDAIITGVTDQGTYARVFTPPVEGRVTQRAGHHDVGDRVRVRLTSTDPARGFIDFAIV